MGVFRRVGSPFWVIEFVYKGERHKFSSGTASKREAMDIETSRRAELRDQVINGKLTTLDDNASIEIVGGEVFFSHVRRGGSS